MPRAKKASTQERIEAKKAEIAELSQKLSTAKEELKALEKEKEDEDLKKLYEAVKASGKTVDDVIAMLGQTED